MNKSTISITNSAFIQNVYNNKNCKYFFINNISKKGICTNLASIQNVSCHTRVVDINSGYKTKENSTLSPENHKKELIFSKA